MPFGTNPQQWDVELIHYEQKTYDPQLDYATTYYWRVDLIADQQLIPGQLLSFTTGGKTSNPYPADEDEDIEIGLIDLSWTGDDFATSYRVYTGTTPVPSEMTEVVSSILPNLFSSYYQQ